MNRRDVLIAGAVGAATTLAGGGATAVAAPTPCGPRYTGYRPEDFAKPYAKYFEPTVAAPQPHVPAAIADGPVARNLIPARGRLADDIYAAQSPVETGYGMLANGELWVACHTDMPRVTPQMWDWWFGWHSRESARYKLWHPEAHRYAGLREDRAGAYVGNTSYVDEVIGGRLDQLAISFRAPSTFGIDPARFGGTAICATVGTVLAPVNIGVVCHQVRPTESGSEMRSRFYLNVPGLRSFDTRALGCAVRRGVAFPRSVVFDLRFGAALLRHCGEEMHHLARFLPELYAEFGATP